MAGQKHGLDGGEIEPSPAISPYMPMFETFRDALDEHHDRRERIIKASRDITALSKKIIFSLQRVRKIQSPILSSVGKDILTREENVQELFLSIAPDLQDINAWRYQRQISGGCQEYVEAISFQHYLERQALITYEEARKRIPGGVELTVEDYLLGLFDLTGELMRFAITSMAANGSIPRGTSGDGARDILGDLRGLRTAFESLDTSSTPLNNSYLKQDIEKKIAVMRQSVGKVEDAMYGMIIRGRERPKGWVPDLTDGQEHMKEAVESY